MIYCIECNSSIWLRKKPLDYVTAFDSSRTRVIVKYAGRYEDKFGALYHAYIDLVSGGFLRSGSKLEDSGYEIVWRIE